MKKFLIVFGVLTLQLAFAGTDGSGADDGGQGVICSKFTRVGGFVPVLEFLDLFEARREYDSHWSKSYAYIEYNSPWKSVDACRHLKFQKKKLAASVGENHPILKYFNKACSLKVVFVEQPPKPTGDIGVLQTQIPRSCDVVQIGARSRSSNIIHISTDYAYMTVADVAALLLHESLHEYFDKKDSNLVVRQTVGFIFADQEFQSRNREMLLQLIDAKKAVYIRWLK